MEAKAPPDPSTPSDKTTPSDNSLDSLDINALNLNATDASMPEREDATPKFNAEHFRTRLPRIQDASRRLQNALDVRNEVFWPVPSKPRFKIDSDIYVVNVAALGIALKDCGKYYVAMDRSSEHEGVLDAAVKDIQKRKVRTVVKADQEAAVVEGDKKGKKKRNKKNKGKGKEEQGLQDKWEIAAAGGQESPVYTGQDTSDDEQDTPKIGTEVCGSKLLPSFRVELTSGMPGLSNRC